MAKGAGYPGKKKEVIVRPPRRPQEAIGRHSRALCAWPYAFSKIYDRVYDKANGGPLSYGRGGPTVAA